MRGRMFQSGTSSSRQRPASSPALRWLNQQTAGDPDGYEALEAPDGLTPNPLVRESTD